MTLREAQRRVRQTSTPERVVRHRVHEESCPAHGGTGMGCRCERVRHAHGVVLDTRRGRR